MSLDVLQFLTILSMTVFVIPWHRPHFPLPEDSTTRPPSGVIPLYSGYPVPGNHLGSFDHWDTSFSQTNLTFLQVTSNDSSK